MMHVRAFVFLLVLIVFPSTCRIYNNHVFVDWRDRRMGNGSVDFASLNFTSAAAYGSAIQSLPEFDNPCSRIWQRYFSNTTSHLTWFTGKHLVEEEQYIADCTRKVLAWQEGVIQIR